MRAARVCVVRRVILIVCSFRRYYERGEIKNYENVECEWPMFFMFMIIDGAFKNLHEQISEYQELLKPMIVFDQNRGKF